MDLDIIAYLHLIRNEALRATFEVVPTGCRKQRSRNLSVSFVYICTSSTAQLREGE